MWEERDVNHSRLTVWRFGLKDPHTGQRQAYSDLATLTEALHTMISTVDEANIEFPAGLSLPNPKIADSRKQDSDIGPKEAGADSQQK
jgi:hypothetical protein